MARVVRPLLAMLPLALLLGLAAGAAAQTSTPPGGGQLPRWEAGIAAGAGRVPDYPGADTSQLRGLVLPYLVYRGPVLRVDERGIRSRFLDTADWEFDLTGTAAFNSRSNDLRDGMPELDYMFGIGPQLVYKGWLAPAGGPSLHLKLRALGSTDFERIDSRGASFVPELRWRWQGVAGAASALTLSIEPTWASRPLHRYFYEVDASQATPTRPAYTARAGYFGTEFGATLRQRVSRELSWFVAANLMSLHGAANTASPLLASRTNLAVGAWLVWTPWRSSAPAAD
ncbi:MipA/OmpV family protein [uncultured Piscinibacter sp.]|uniref:MipA/OmpV family protein n=1 Tax=uncultured Piscinibacter sp. TaxID=1131835 RepID=UPI0026171B86|nr:MipA/OmpV family protein [uncultured Piscinibacter sp.]